MIRLPWAFTLALTLVALIGILIVTHDLGTTRNTFARGVDEARTIEQTTDKALDGAAALPPSIESVSQGVPHISEVSRSMIRANHSLGTMAESLSDLALALESADQPLQGIVAAAGDARTGAASAIPPVETITSQLASITQKTQTLNTQLQQTEALGSTIDSKLRIALLIPEY